MPWPPTGCTAASTRWSPKPSASWPPGPSQPPIHRPPPCRVAWRPLENHAILLLTCLAYGRSSEARSPEEPVFLLRAKELEELGSIEEPTEEQENRVVELVRAVPEYRRHFYANAT